MARRVKPVLLLPLLILLLLHQLSPAHGARDARRSRSGGRAAPSAAGTGTGSAAYAAGTGSATHAAGSSTPAPQWLAQYSHLTAASPVGAALRALHALQHPPLDSCRSRRLAVVQHTVRKFEGTGSTMKQVFMALAEAVHANRTLVWGLEQPYMFEYARPLWETRAAAEAAADAAGGLPLECQEWRGRGGGPYACFFQTLSSCSLADATPDELVQLGMDGLRDDARIKVQEERRGVAAYHVPAGVFEALLAPPPDGTAAQPRVAWAAALMAYITRLQPALLAALTARRAALWWPRDAARSAAPDRGTVWGIHVRSGDVAALQSTYGNRQVFSLDAAWAATVAHAATVAATDAPALLFLASDDVASGAWAANLTASGRLAAEWPAALPRPRLVAAADSARLKAAWGSHTAAANGGCQGAECALPAAAVLQLRLESSAAGAQPQPARLLRVLADAVEDAFLLSGTHRLVTQCTSHFSAMAALMMWAASGSGGAGDTGPRGDALVCLDAAGIASGSLQSGFLHGALNGTTLVPPSRGGERWTMLTKRVVEGITPADTAACGGHITGYTAACGDASVRMFQDGALPALPDAVFRAEAARWSAAVPRVWRGECPAPAAAAAAAAGAAGAVPRDAAADALARLAANVNLGAAHYEVFHTNQALRCWRQAAADLALLAPHLPPERVTLLTDIVGGNVQSLRADRLYPYAISAAVLERCLADNLAVNVSVAAAWAARYSNDDAMPASMRPVAPPPARLPPARPPLAVPLAPPPPPPAPAAAAPLTPTGAYSPVQLGCRCPTAAAAAALAGGTRAMSVMVVGWSGVPHSYAIVGDGLRSGLAQVAAATGASLDWVAAPWYMREWEADGGRGREATTAVSSRGMAVQYAVWRDGRGVVTPPDLGGVRPLPQQATPGVRARGAAPAWAGASPPTCPDAVIRVHYPLDLSPPPCRGMAVLVVGTTEEGAARREAAYQAATDANVLSRLPPHVRIAAPSRWSAAGFQAAGVPPAAVVVLPHGVDADLFRPLPPAQRAATRRALGWADDGCIVVATMGHMRWLKGTDLLLRAAVMVAARLQAGSSRGTPPRCLRLLLKGLDTLYASGDRINSWLDDLPGTGGAATLRDAIAAQVAAGSLVLDVRGAQLPAAGVAQLLAAADVYVSPYRAEGFNLPVLEAAAAGLPLIVTGGGATDDFTDASFARYLAAVRVPPSREEEDRDGTGILAARGHHLQPDLEDLVAAMHDSLSNATWRAAAGAAAAAWVRTHGFTWRDVAAAHLAALASDLAATNNVAVEPGGT